MNEAFKTWSCGDHGVALRLLLKGVGHVVSNLVLSVYGAGWGTGNIEGNTI